METIRNYLDNMFARLPQNKELGRLKEEIYFNMEEKYFELINDGKQKMKQLVL